MEIKSLLTKLIDETEDAPIENVFIGLYSIYVKGVRVGLSSTMHQFVKHLPVEDLENLEAKSTKELAQYIFSNRILEATLGMAAINSSIKMDEKYFVEKNAFDIIHDKSIGKKVAVFGDFPFVKKLKPISEELFLFEKKEGSEYLREDDMPSILPKADLVVISGTTIFNHTFIDILKNCSDSSFKIILGPSTPLTTVLFDYGIDVISGVMVSDEDKVFKYISRAAPFKYIKGKTFICMIK
ncbi:DUF364 domain-containing protein [Candidatus Dependentiae bacterium]|nr:DUF364 domain-containing protein [Candidatus Dependentiae bacterium]